MAASADLHEFVAASPRPPGETARASRAGRAQTSGSANRRSHAAGRPAADRRLRRPGAGQAARLPPAPARCDWPASAGCWQPTTKQSPAETSVGRLARMPDRCRAPGWCTRTVAAERLSRIDALDFDVAAVDQPLALPAAAAGRPRSIVDRPGRIAIERRVRPAIAGHDRKLSRRLAGASSMGGRSRLCGSTGIFWACVVEPGDARSAAASFARGACARGSCFRLVA